MLKFILKIILFILFLLNYSLAEIVNNVKISGNKVIDNIEIFDRMSLPAPFNLFKPIVNIAFKTSGIDPFYTRFASTFELRLNSGQTFDGTGVMEIMDLQ